MANEPHVTYRTSAGEWELMHEWTHTFLGPLVIPAGFRFDLASIPRVVWTVIAPFELSVAAPLAHDFLYRSGGGFGLFSRSDADRIFRELMKEEGVSAWRRHVAYSAVRLFGGNAWQG